MIAEKNRDSWNAFANQYAAYSHAEQLLGPIVKDPSKAFHTVMWEQLKQFIPSLHGKRVCVPSSGDNHAVFAFALLGAQVTSCDIAENQLENAQKAAERIGIAGQIDFIRADTMKLEGIEDGAYDLVYTSNGVHVWIDRLDKMYQNIFRVLKPGGIYMMYEIHPLQRPFDDNLKIVKPYDCTGPFENESEVTFHWRIQDILNAIADAGIRIRHIEEMPDEKNYEWPFWLSCEEVVKGVTASREEVDRMYDWRQNPAAALPNFLGVLGVKE